MRQLNRLLLNLIIKTEWHTKNVAVKPPISLMSRPSLLCCLSPWERVVSISGVVVDHCDKLSLRCSRFAQGKMGVVNDIITVCYLFQPKTRLRFARVFARRRAFVKITTICLTAMTISGVGVWRFMGTSWYKSLMSSLAAIIYRSVKLNRRQLWTRSWVNLISQYSSTTYSSGTVTRLARKRVIIDSRKRTHYISFTKTAWNKTT